MTRKLFSDILIPDAFLGEQFMKPYLPGVKTFRHWLTLRNLDIMAKELGNAPAHPII